MRIAKLALVILATTACNKKQDEAPPPPTPTPANPGPKAGADDQKLLDEAKQFTKDLEPKLRKLLVDASLADWNNQTDITKEHEAASAKAAETASVEVTKLVKTARKFEPVLGKLDPETRRQLLLLKFQAQPAPDDPKEAKELAELATEMASLYGKGVCTTENGKETCKDVEYWSKQLQQAKTPDAMLAAWKGWHDGVGHIEKDKFVRFVELANKGAQGIGFKSIAEFWQAPYDMPPAEFVATVDKLWDQVKPLYTQMHCYARRVLNKQYGDKVVPPTGLIPAHVTANMWAQTWGDLYPQLEPYKGVAPIDVTPVLKKSYDPQKMVRMGEAFYTSLGMDPLPQTFWERSMLAHPAGKDVVCHASAWDVQYSNDLRIKMCININQDDLWVIHHELGHNYYQHAYYQLPIIYQNGANDGFHEAIGDTIQLSMTPEYLKEKGLLAKVEKNDKATINQQMRVALDKVVFLPWGLMVDKWRWDVFSGAVKPDQYNQHWWDLRKQYEGIAPPIERSAADFDPGAKYHVASNVPYMRYFLAAVLQFQFHRALCTKAGFTGPLNECSIYGNKAAGEAYQKMLAMGVSKPWQDALEVLTGSREMDASAILEYFAPLQKWLEEQNKGQQCGW